MDDETKTDGASAKASTRRKPGQLRRDIDEAARTLFRERGFDGTSMRDIAFAAGTTVAMLYRHFPNKAAVFRECVVAPFHEFVDEFLAAMRTHSVADLPNRELFARFSETVYDLAVKNRSVLLAMLAAHKFSADEVGDLGRVGPGLLDFVHGFAEQQHARGWDDVDVDVAARASVAMVLGLALFDDLLLTPKAKPISRKRLIAELTEFQLHGYRRGAAAGED